MRLLYLTDTHIRGTSPRSRNDDFPSTMKKKLEEVIQIVHREQIDAVLHGGDLFDRPDLSPAIVGQFAAFFRRFQVPVYAIAGNHDLFGHNPDTVGRTMLGLLDALGVLRLIRPGEVIFMEKEGRKVQLSGQPFHYDLDKRAPELDYSVPGRNGADVCIHMVHGMLVDRPLPEGVAHTLIDHVWQADFDLLLTGHYHAGFPLQRREGRVIVNPGALARVNNHVSEVQRMPQVAIITLEEEIDVRLLPLTSAVNGSEVLDRSYLQKKSYQEEKMNDFLQVVRAAGKVESISIAEIIDHIAKMHKVEDSVRKEALLRIAAVEEQLATRGGTGSR